MEPRSSLTTVDLLGEAAGFPPHEENGRRAETLIKTPDLRVVLVTTRPSAELTEHAAPGTITVQPLQGRFLFSTADAEQELGPGMLISVEGGVRHVVRCLEEGSFLLMLAWPGLGTVESTG